MTTKEMTFVGRPHESAERTPALAAVRNNGSPGEGRMRLKQWSALVLAVGALAGCTTTATLSVDTDHRAATGPSGLVSLVPFVLDTHCGIREVMYRGKYYVRPGGVLDDGQGNPPAGWDNPTQAGVLAVYTSKAVFSDAKGHRETFMLRPGATSFESACS